jgi:hypothetical protein
VDLDRPKKALAAFIRWVMRDVTYHRLYPATVQRQDTDGTLDLYPEDPAIQGTGLSKVRIRHGLPGVTVKVPTGANVLLGFENGDPAKPYAALWNSGSVTEIVFDNGTQAIARQNDTVRVTVPPGTFLVAASGGSFNPAPVQLDGTITAGNSKFKA